MEPRAARECGFASRRGGAPGVCRSPTCRRHRTGVGLERMWNTNLAVVDAVLGGKRQAWPSSFGLVLARCTRADCSRGSHQQACRACLERPRDVPPAVACALRDTSVPATDENWVTQLRRSCLAIFHAFRPGSDHEESLAWIGPRAKPRRPHSISDSVAAQSGAPRRTARISGCGYRPCRCIERC